MQAENENIKYNYFSSILFIVVFSLGLLLWHNSYYNPVVERCTVMSEATTGGDEAVISTGAEFQTLNICLPYHKISLLSPARSRMTENRKSNLLLAQLEDKHYDGFSAPKIFFSYHLFPTEKDDLPPLS